MTTKSIEELVNELEAHRVRFMPSKQAYLRFMFEFNWQLFDQSGETPVHDSSQFLPCVKRFIQDDIKKARFEYYKNNRFYKLWAPDIKYAKKYAKDYLKGKF